MPTIDHTDTTRAADALDYVRELFERGHAALPPSSSHRDGAGGGSGPGSRPPLSVALLDALQAVEEHMNRAWPDIAGALGSGRNVGSDLDTITARTRARFDYLAPRLRFVGEWSPALCASLTAEWLAGGRRVLGALGERPRPFPTAGECPDCDGAALWLSPEQMRIKCEECLDEWPLDAAPTCGGALTETVPSV